MIVSTRQIAEIFSITDRGVRLWSDKGCPKAGHGKWDVRDVLLWWLENLYQSDSDSEELAQAKLEYWQAKARTEKVKADLAEGASMEVKDFKQAWVWRVSEMSNGLGALPLRLSPLLAGKSEKDIKKILESEIWQIRDKFSRTGKFTPAPGKKGKNKKNRKKTL